MKTFLTAFKSSSDVENEDAQTEKKREFRALFDFNHPDAGRSNNDDSTPLQLDAFITYRIARLQAQLDNQLQQVLRATCGLNKTEWRLVNIIGHAEKVSIRSLEMKTGIEKSLIMATLSDLLRFGLIHQTETEDSESPESFELTENGNLIFDKMTPIVQARQANTLSGFSQEERTTLYEFLDRISQNVANETFRAAQLVRQAENSEDTSS